MRQVRMSALNGHVNTGGMDMTEANDDMLSSAVSMNRLATDLGVSRSTLWRWHRTGHGGAMLKTILVGRRRYVLRKDLDAFVNACSQLATAKQVLYRFNRQGYNTDDL